MNETYSEFNTTVLSEYWCLTIPPYTKFTDEVLEHYQNTLYELDNKEISSVVLPAGWELNRI